MTGPTDRWTVGADIFTQAGDIRFEWGVAGADQLARSSQVLIIVDIFSFSTAVDVAVSRGAVVYPYPSHNSGAAEYANTVGARLAVDRRHLSPRDPYSLSPRSLRDIPAGTRLVLPSPNGSTISAAAAQSGCHVLAGCLRNRAAVARAAIELGAPIAIIAAGERWPDGSLRPALEDLLGAGAFISWLMGQGLSPSVEGGASAAPFEAARDGLISILEQTKSARELAAIGFKDDATIAGQLDVSDACPILQANAFQRRPDLT